MPTRSDLPTNRCDIVMKGGVTSGVIYPGAVAELMRKFRLMNVGGTSAGAIAAAAAAAAEYGRQNRAPVDSPGARFPRGREGLEEISKWVGRVESGRRTNTRRLFQPQPKTRALFNVLLAIVGSGSGWTRFWGVWRSWAMPLVPGLTVALIAVVAWILGHGGSIVGMAVVLGLALAVAGIVVVVVEIPRLLAGNYFGLCTGMGDANALTPWLDTTLNELAGLSDGRPLTFGDLWYPGTPWPPPSAPSRRLGPPTDSRPIPAAINLELFTTCLSLLRPLRLPLELGEQAPRTPGELRFEFFFVPTELEKLFPTRVISWMKLASPAPAADGDPAKRWAMPYPGDLPVVLAARLSLSVPPLVSGVPLWVRDNRKPTADPQRCWFTDGGLSSNFPLHFFDRAIPRWPTFAINLTGLKEPGKSVTASAFGVSIGVIEDELQLEAPAGLDSDLAAERDKVWLASIPTDLPPAQLAQWEQRPIGFFTSMLDAMRGWRDRLYTEMPGFCERVVHVGQTKAEGGFNLDMGGPTIDALAARGRVAGRLLCERYDEPVPARNGWRRHYWTRYRVGMAATTPWLTAFTSGAEGRGANEPHQDWKAMLSGGPGIDDPDFAVAHGSDALAARTNALAALGEAASPQPTGDENAPRPHPELRAGPRA